MSLHASGRGWQSASASAAPHAAPTEYAQYSWALHVLPASAPQNFALAAPAAPALDAPPLAPPPLEAPPLEAPPFGAPALAAPPAPAEDVPPPVSAGAMDLVPAAAPVGPSLACPEQATNCTPISETSSQETTLFMPSHLANHGPLKISPKDPLYEAELGTLCASLGQCCQSTATRTACCCPARFSGTPP